MPAILVEAPDMVSLSHKHSFKWTYGLCCVDHRVDTLLLISRRKYYVKFVFDWTILIYIFKSFAFKIRYLADLNI